MKQKSTKIGNKMSHSSSTGSTLPMSPNRCKVRPTPIIVWAKLALAAIVGVGILPSIMSANESHYGVSVIGVSASSPKPHTASHYQRFVRHEEYKGAGLVAGKDILHSHSYSCSSTRQRGHQRQRQRRSANSVLRGIDPLHDRHRGITGMVDHNHSSRADNAWVRLMRLRGGHSKAVNDNESSDGDGAVDTINNDGHDVGDDVHEESDPETVSDADTDTVGDGGDEHAEAHQQENSDAQNTVSDSQDESAKGSEDANEDDPNQKLQSQKQESHTDDDNNDGTNSEITENTTDLSSDNGDLSTTEDSSNTPNTKPKPKSNTKIKTKPKNPKTIQTLRESASQLRTHGKELHDQGHFQRAADTFQRAANELEDAMAVWTDCAAADDGDDGDGGEDLESSGDDGAKLLSGLAEECATCLLHQALCHLKEKNYIQCIQSCTDVLRDGVQVVPLSHEYQQLQQQQQQAGEQEEQTDPNDQNQTQTTTTQPTTILITPNEKNTTTPTSSITSSSQEWTAAVRARAFHRRAKARLALGDAEGALDDSRAAAYLGDRNAVMLYGRLMREQGHDGGVGAGSGGAGVGDGGLLSSSSSSSVLESLFMGDTTANNEGGGSILDQSSSSPSSSSSSSTFDILNSFMGSTDTNGPTSVNPLSAFGDMGNLMNLVNTNKNSEGLGVGFDSMAKSLLLSLTKKIEDESTQKTISNFLQGLDVTQLMGLSSMAGVPLNKSSADKLVKFANGFTPTRIRKGVNLTKRVITLGNALRKLFKVISKYKHLLILFVLISWIKSAILKPIVVGNGAVRKAAKKAAKEALRDSVATSSLLF